MRNRMYGGVRGRKTKVGRKLLRFPPTRFCLLRQLLSYSPPFVADSPDRRNNSAKNMAYFLE